MEVLPSSGTFDTTGSSSSSATTTLPVPLQVTCPVFPVPAARARGGAMLHLRLTPDVASQAPRFLKDLRIRSKFVVSIRKQQQQQQQWQQQPQLSQQQC